MLIIKLLVLIFFVLISGCTGFDFVYENYETDSFLKEKTLISVEGDDRSTIKTTLNNLLKNTEDERLYKLEVISKKTLKNLVVESSQVATQIEISHNILYQLKSAKKNCLIDSKEIKTKIDYTVKSEGYNFGSDSSKKEITKNNIATNINRYINYAINNLQYKTCKQ